MLELIETIMGWPSAFTQAIIRQMNLNRPAGSPEITWDVLHELYESKIVSCVLVLDVEAFAAGQGHSDSGNHNSRGALVKHHYHASNWPSRHPRFKHPAYGPVEQCNWDPVCVSKWDADTAAFALLSEEEKKVSAESVQMESDKLRKQQDAFLNALADKSPQRQAFLDALALQAQQKPIKVAQPGSDQILAQAAAQLDPTTEEQSLEGGAEPATASDPETAPASAPEAAPENPEHLQSEQAQQWKWPGFPCTSVPLTVSHKVGATKVS